MAKMMKQAAIAATAMAVFCATLYMYNGNGTVLALAITFGTTSYHLLMRLLVGVTADLLLGNRVDYRRRWFRVSAAEQKLYHFIKVKKWKGNMPTYDPESFDSRLRTWDEIAGAMCQAELVHEVIILLSFLPILASIPFGALPAFAITSVLAACYDGMFVIMQRYNRPRIVKLIEKAEKRGQVMIQEAVARIRQMEQIFDELQEAAIENPSAIREDAALGEMLGCLVQYYEGGRWQKDYELDENGLIPQNLKRGVLSQDAVYDFLERFKSYLNI